TGMENVATGARPTSVVVLASGASRTVAVSAGGAVAARAFGVAADPATPAAHSRATAAVVAAAARCGARERRGAPQPRWPSSSRTVATIATVFFAVVYSSAVAA